MWTRLVSAWVLAAVAYSEARGFELVRAGKAAATIVVSEKAPEPERLAAAELQALLERSTGARLAIAAKAPDGGQPAVLVGQAAVREAGEKLAAAVPFAQMRDDGYSVTLVAQPPALLVVGNQPRGTLRAVYDLLEATLGCAFFVDGDHVPARKDAVVQAGAIVANPAFPDRTCYVPVGLYGPKRFQATLWNAEDWKAHLRWMAKRGLNCLAVPFTASSRAWGAAFDKAFPEAKAHRQETLAAQGGPTARMGWGLHPDHTTAVLSEAFAFARKSLGIEVAYVFAFGDFEEPLRKAAPGLKWLPEQASPLPAPAGGSCTLSGAEPKCRELQARLWKAIIETYGTGHRYVVACQDAPTAVALDVLRQVDPAMKALVPTWEAPRWGATAAAQAEFIRQLPKEAKLLYSDPDLGPLYTATERLADRPFQYAVPWGGAACNDLLENRFGMLANTFHHFEHSRPRPRADGFWNWNELLRVNPMMDHLSSVFAWDASFVWRAEGAATNRAVNDYLERRYGPGAVFPMAEAHKQALRGAPRLEAGANYREYVRLATLPAPGSAAARTAIALALACKAAIAPGSFYEPDLADMGRGYLHQCIQEQCARVLATVRDAKRAAGSKAYTDQLKKDSLAAVQKAEARLTAAHKALSRLIATRKDMCLDEAIMEAVATKGANKLLPQAIREHQSGLFANAYPLTDSIEYHQHVAARQLRHLLDYAKREADAPTAEPVPGWETFFGQGAAEFVEKCEPAGYDKKAEKATPSAILQEFLESGE